MGRWIVAAGAAALTVVGCCRPAGTDTATEAAAPASSTPPPVAAPAPSGEIATGDSELAECKGDMADSETPCSLNDGRVGWCKKGMCKDVCPAGFSYFATDTQCHKRCNASCKNCMDGFCMDRAATRSMLPQP